MDDLKLGRLITSLHQQRDAIHIAVAPVVASEVLKPGERIGFLQDGTVGLGNSDRPSIGIVDPYLDRSVTEGQRFWMFLMPGSITSLRHDWTHPAFRAERVDGDKIAAQKWLETFASSQRHSFNRLAEILEEAVTTGGAWCGDNDNSESFNDQRRELLRQWEIWTGKPLPRDTDNIYFSCAC